MAQVPIIDVTDLYHPAEDPGDNFDLIMPYGLPEIDLKAVIIDVTEENRHRVDAGVPNFHGPRDPGIIPVTQLNAIFGTNVPYAVGPFSRMRTIDDAMEEVPRFQQFGIELILNTLRASEEKVHVLSFGSARTIAAAYNRDPQLFHDRMACLHLSAGSTEPTFLEWNVQLDPKAIIRLIGTDLPIALYPCANGEEAFRYDQHNTYWSLRNLKWVAGMDPRLSRYLAFAMAPAARMDFLRAVEALPGDVLEWPEDRRHAVWETAIWAQVSGRRIVRRASGEYRIVPKNEVRSGDAVIRNDLVPCTVQARDDGLYTFQLTDDPTTCRVFVRDDPAQYERALNEALPALYQSFASEMRK